MILIDVTLLSLVITDLRKYFERTLKRGLQEISLSELITYLALNSGITKGESQAQILVVYDKNSVRLSNCVPSDLSTELNGVMFRDQSGEFSFAGVPYEEMVSRKELYPGLSNIITDSVGVRQLVLVSFNEEHGDKAMNRLRKIKNKKTIQLHMNELEEILGGHQ